ncbi:hypothetical protein VKT23_013014 [Stygiomarasmius scandens]|uniref:Protein kinase domain-containing protein n=1 Tax=Marasmiellus scandens TaxID=2682957 RepID=A0ABR1J9N7_9AGAR
MARPPILPTNGRNYSQNVNAVAEFKFESEPLGMPAASGQGYPYLEFGQAVGDDGRYVIRRKLGWGLTSSIWLALDRKECKYVAIKVLKGYYTNLSLQEDKKLWEIESLIKLGQRSPHCVELLNHWRAPGQGSSGEHIFLVTDLFGGDVGRLMTSLGRPLPLKLSKRILLHTLRGIASAHRAGVMHTDLKEDNIFFTNAMSSDQIDAWLASNPSRRHEPEISEDGVIQTAVSQPLPMISVEEAMRRNFVIGDFGNALPKDTYQGITVSPVALRAPEVYIGSPVNEKADIWSFGCLIFEIVTKHRLFRFTTAPKYQMAPEEFMLYQMYSFTQEPFQAEQLQAGLYSEKYFEADCTFRSKQAQYTFTPIEEWIRHYVKKLSPALDLSESDIVATGTLIRRCLTLNPDSRASAEELLSDPWFKGVE